jgi:hypothetical protein
MAMAKWRRRQMKEIRWRNNEISANQLAALWRNIESMSSMAK